MSDWARWASGLVGLGLALVFATYKVLFANRGPLLGLLLALGFTLATALPVALLSERIGTPEAATVAGWVVIQFVAVAALLWRRRRSR